jgi:4,5-DOPA dioxygenase extradiol
LAREAARLLTEAGLKPELDEQRGLDHGAWVPLLYLLPQPRTPVFQVSMPLSLTTADALQLGRALAPLREQGVLIIGSGSMTHNLGEFRGPSSTVADYVLAFEAWVRQAVLDNNLDAMVNYRSLAPAAQRAHPTQEHFLPLLVALGAQLAGDTVQGLEGGVTYGMLSMHSFMWGQTGQV